MVVAALEMMPPSSDLGSPLRPAPAPVRGTRLGSAGALLVCAGLCFAAGRASSAGGRMEAAGLAGVSGVSGAPGAPGAATDAMAAVLEAAGLSAPEQLDPVFIAGHVPALWVYRTPTKEVRVEGSNVGPSNSIEISLRGTDSTGGNQLRAMMVYAQAFQTTGVELKLPTYFLPNDRRVLEVVRQGEVLHSCEVPADEVCKYDFGAADAGKRFTVKAFEAESGKLLQVERIYAPLPYMCAASTYSRQDTTEMDCSPVEAPKSSLDFSRTSKRGWAIEIEFSARDTSLSSGVYGPEALAKVRQCVDAKVEGSLDLSSWHWEEEDAMIPFTPRDTDDAGEYGGYMAELTSPGPPSVLLGQDGVDQVAGVFATLQHMGVQVGLWAQFHVHVNALSKTANPAAECCLTSDEIANVWAAWAEFQAVIDEMQSSTNVDNRWAMPLYLEDPIVRRVFENMHAAFGTDLPAEQACQTFYGQGYCDDTHGDNAYRPPNARPGAVAYQHSPPRYYALNLAPLAGKGTIEFRQQAGTHDAERAERWAQFILAFVETFKDDASLFQGAFREDVALLKQRQEQASFAELFRRLGERVDAASQSYYTERKWARTDDGHEDPRCSFA